MKVNIKLRRKCYPRTSRYSV